VIENSAAFEAAIEAGYHTSDLQLSSDGVPIVFHDDDLER
jgi:glycerophosphoryl diester phosphodiesterase